MPVSRSLAARSRQRWPLLALILSLSGCRAADGDSEVAALYVTSGVTDEVLRLDPADGSLVGRISLDRRRGEVDEPHGVAVSPDGRYGYVTLAHGEPTLWKFEVGSDRVIGRVPLGTSGAARIGISPNGRRGFVPDYYRAAGGRVSRIAVVDLVDMRVLDRPRICAAPHHAEVSGRLVAVTCSLSDELVLLDAESLQVVRRFYVDRDPGPPGEPRYKPLNLAWSAAGDRVYVTLFRSAEVRAYDLEGGQVGALTVGAGPAQAALTPDGSGLVVANRDDDSVSLIDVDSMVERARIAVGRSHPHGVALDRTGRIAYVSTEGDVGTAGGVVALDLQDRRLLWSRDAGHYTLGIAYRPSNVTE